jgi:hypothetical protein
MSKRRCNTSARGPGNLASTLTALRSWATPPGAHLSALVALAGEEPVFSTEYRNDRNSSISHTVKAVGAFMAFTTCFGNGSTIRYLDRANRSPAVRQFGRDHRQVRGLRRLPDCASPAPGW